MKGNAKESSVQSMVVCGGGLKTMDYNIQILFTLASVTLTGTFTSVI